MDTKAGSDHRPSPLLVLAVTSLLAIHAMLAWRGVYNRSVTSDETGHLTAGYAYWKYCDFRLQPENGNLPQRWGALPLLIARPAIDPAKDSGNWVRSNVWNIAQGFLFESGNNSEFLLLCARTTMLAWSIAAGLVVFFWARKIWGSAAAVGSLALFAFSPTTLAHAPLVTSDMCAAVCLLIAVAAWWHMCLRPSVRRAVFAGVGTGMAFLAKFSAVTLLPVFAVLVAMTLYAERRSIGRRPARHLFAAIGLAVAVVYLLIWGFFLFRYSAPDAVIPFSRFYIPWEVVAQREGSLRYIIRFARDWHLLPEAYLYGFSFVLYFAAERGAFVAGQFSTTGWWWFFPFAFLVKSTIGELVITGLVLTRSWFAARQLLGGTLNKVVRSPLLPLLLFGLVFGAVSIGSHLNIGQRHILPLYLVLFILSGGLFSASRPVLLRIAAGLAVLASAFETLANSPNHLAFFNRLVGGPQNGWHLLVDSSLDWGQDVAPLADWVRRNRKPGEPIFVSCFGTADPIYEGIERASMLSPYYSLGRQRTWFELQPGLYCVSATMIQDVYGIRPGPWSGVLEKHFQQLKASARINIPNGLWDRRLPNTGHHPENPLWLLDRLRFARLCHYLKSRKPDAVINHTQFVFRLTPEEIDAFSHKPYSALAAMIEKASERSGR